MLHTHIHTRYSGCFSVNFARVSLGNTSVWQDLCHLSGWKNGDLTHYFLGSNGSSLKGGRFGWKTLVDPLCSKSLSIFGRFDAHVFKELFCSNPWWMGERSSILPNQLCRNKETFTKSHLHNSGEEWSSFASQQDTTESCLYEYTYMVLSNTCSIYIVILLHRTHTTNPPMDSRVSLLLNLAIQIYQYMYTQTLNIRVNKPILIHSVQLSHPTAFLTSLQIFFHSAKGLFHQSFWEYVALRWIPMRSSSNLDWSSAPKRMPRTQGVQMLGVTFWHFLLVQGFTPQKKSYRYQKMTTMYLWLQLWLAILGIGCIFSFQAPSAMKSPHYPPKKKRKTGCFLCEVMVMFPKIIIWIPLL